MFNETLKIGNGATATTLNSADNSDLFLAQYTLDGTLLWTQQGTGQGSGMIFSIAAKNESILATGYYDETLTFSGSTPVTLLPIDTGDKFFVAKFNADDGQAHWAQKAGGVFGSIGWDVTTDDSDQVYATGHYYDDIDFYNGSTIFRSLTNSHDTMFMIKYRSDGTPEWTHQAGGASRGSMSVTLDETGNPLFTGAFNQYPAVFTTGPSGQTAMSNTSGAGLYNSNGNFLGFAEPGIDLILAEESSGRPAIIGRENKVMACDTLLVNIPPVASDDSMSTTEGQDINIAVLDNDTDAEGDNLSVTDVSQGVNGSVAIEPDGLGVTYTPDAGFIGSDSFTYTISDGNGGTASATVTILVTSSTTELTVTDIQPPDSGTVALNQSFTFTFNEPIASSSCYSSISLEDSSNVSAAVNTTVNGNILTVEPAAVLAAGTDYLLTVPSCALAGTTGDNTLAADFTHLFTTEGGSASILFTDIVAGYDHVLALDSDGNVWAWGKNDYGQVGDSSLTDQLTPVQVQGLNGITKIAAGAYHNLALDNFGSVWGWGRNGDGELGNGTQNTSNIPTQVYGLSDVIAITTGSFHSIALKGNGTVWTWGMNSSYQLGHGLGGSTDELTPGQIANLFNVTDVAGGYNFTSVLKQDGTVWSWGRNNRGQLGTGDTINRTIPTAALLPANITSIHGSLNSRAFAITSDNSIWGWGYNSGYGAVGNGNGWDQPTPIKVFENAIDFSSGGEHTVALATDFSLWAWGRNSEGEYGTGITSYSSSPVSAANLANITAVAAGKNFTAILKENGTIWCWGSNHNGQLGNNTTEQSLIPVQVMMQ
jgi:alpha-tubulin suppressor-like RCC1 family protein